MAKVPPDPAGLIARAFEYGIPAFETARLTYDFSYNMGNPRRVPAGRFAHRRTLADHRHRMLTTPNNDTLYSSAVLDLSAGPVTLDLPAFGDRYHSIAFLDAYTNNFAYIGTRTTGGKGGSYRIAGPGWQGDMRGEATVIHAPSPHITAHMRILVDGISDYAEVHRLQDAVRFSGPTPPARPDLIRPVAGDAENFVTVVNQVLLQDPPPSTDAPILQVLAPTGIGADAPALTPDQRARWGQYFAAGRSDLIAASQQIGQAVQGWQYLPPNIGNFGTDYETRAKIAIRGIVANVAAESIYTLTMVDGTGAPLASDHRYRMRLPAGVPPVDAFWSLSIYEMMPDGSMFFGENEIRRYSVGSLTRDLVRNADGSLDILIQKDRTGDRIANWLPIPAGNFALIMRAYLPRPEMRNGGFRYPGIERMR